jgi:CheY-like chemotaxis protein
VTRRAEGGSDVSGEGPLVIIVDPNRDVRTILVSLLNSRGFRALATADPGEAFRWARGRSPAVLIGEHPLPLDDGRPLCTALLEDPSTAHIPFVAVTSRAFPEDLRGAKETHLHGVFAKPVQPRRILEHIRTLIQARDREGQEDSGSTAGS